MSISLDRQFILNVEFDGKLSIQQFEVNDLEDCYQASVKEAASLTDRFSTN